MTAKKKLVPEKCKNLIKVPDRTIGQSFVFVDFSLHISISIENSSASLCRQLIGRTCLFGAFAC